MASEMGLSAFAVAAFAEPNHEVAVERAGKVFNPPASSGSHK